MVAGWAVVLSALVYLCMLFAVAHWGDLSGKRLMQGRGRATIYALALAVYCTSWTFFGSVGLASRSGLDFLTIYIGPILVIGCGYALVGRVVRIAKAQNITSVADFVAARYGKSERVAALVCVIAVIGTVPYIALQLKAVSVSLGVFLGAADGGQGIGQALPLYGDVALESLVKLAAFLAVGVFVAVAVFGGVFEMAHRLVTAPEMTKLLSHTSDLGGFLTLTMLAASAALLLPRQFHMAVVENRAVEDVRRAAWLFPLYLVLINLFVLPIAFTGLEMFPAGASDRDMTVTGPPATWSLPRWRSSRSAVVSSTIQRRPKRSPQR